MTAISGNTYPVKDKLREMGGRWDPEEKVWRVPDERAEEAKKLVAEAKKDSDSRPRPTKCKVCGVKAWNGLRGSYSNGGSIIYRSGECRDCFEERKMGY
jgi:hypothetical protein